MLSWLGFRKRALKAAGALGAVSLTACATAQPQAEVQTSVAAAPRPAMWKLADADTTIYLFGTIHILPKNHPWKTPVLEQAIAASDELVLETEMGTDLVGTANTMMTLGVSPNLPPLVERVPEAQRDELAALIKETGYPEKALNRMETWAAALTLLAASFRGMGFTGEDGVEKGLEALYKGKRIRGLETVEQQFGFFDTLSEDAQRAFLSSTITEPDEAKATFEAMMRAWSAGDVEGIAASFDSETALSPELREVLMKKRNAAWAEWLAKRLEQPGTVMVAVGAGHLAGRDSVQTMLKARGLETQRVQ